MINKVIAYNRRIMRFFYNIFPDIVVGGRYYSQKQVCGDWYEYYINVFDMKKWRLHAFGEHKINLNKKLYKKFIKGEK
jgi:hypothetical protein